MKTELGCTRCFARMSLAGATILTAVIATACADSPTKPASALSAASSAVAATRGVTVPLIEDASGRLAAAMEDVAIRSRVRDHLTRLSSALEKGNAGLARDQITRLRKIIEARSQSADAADLGSLGLALDQVESQLNTAVGPNK